MLRLENIRKTYNSGETVTALRGVSLGFRKSEFVSILGPSGCGKTTMLNIIGGLDKYDSGDLVIGGTSTKKFKDADWDAYRNSTIGFVFQTYNLIGHQSVLQNVEIALTLSGVSAAERRKRAKQALADVGLSDQTRKKPNQLSGGQMQRVAIARALVNNPDIILADEPTGALDSSTSIQIMEILKEIAKTRLVVMVTHNPDLAERYSTRIVRMLDGEIQSDSSPYAEDSEVSAAEKVRFKKTSMSFTTAAGLSFKNLMTKRGRTIITSFAGSIGIIGIALVLALSSGMSDYIDDMQAETLSGFPVTVSRTAMEVDMQSRVDRVTGARIAEAEKYTEDNIVYRYNREQNTRRHINKLTPDYFDYVAEMETALPNAVNNISYSRNVEMNILAKGEDTVVKFETNSSGGGQMGMMGGGGSYWQELPDNADFILSLYDLIGEGSRLPSAKNEAAIVVDEYNRINKAFFERLGYFTETDSYELTDFIGETVLKVIPNDSFYTLTDEGLFTAAGPSDYGVLYDGADGVELTVTGILRAKESTETVISYLSSGLVYTTALTDYILGDAHNSAIARAQDVSDTDVVTGAPFADDAARERRLLSLGADTTATGIDIYPKNYESKQEITEYLDAYNAGRADEDQVIYSDLGEIVANMTDTLINMISYVLIAFTAISLVVSTIMIAIIIYVSVLERVKEIGILRSVGARKKDISRVFNAEAALIGLGAGLLGVGFAYLISIPLNLIIASLAGVSGIAALPVPYAVLLVLGSMGLTLIAGFIPSKMAAKKNPVEALRTE